VIASDINFIFMTNVGLLTSH